MILNEEKLDEYIDIAYNKALYNARTSLIYDNLELKYVNSNYDNIKKYIKDTINNSKRNSGYSYQYKFKKQDGNYRPLFMDDFINDIISALIVISNGIEVEKLQDDTVSFGNRIEEDMDKPYLFKLYFNQFYEKLKHKELEHIVVYDKYYKIDLAKFYNNINHEKLANTIKKYPELDYGWISDKIENFLKSDIYDCNEGFGLQQNAPLAHFMANLYMLEFDNWFSNRFNNAKLIRYLDDMQIFIMNDKEGEFILEECKNYLINELKLKLNDDKEVKEKSFNLISEKSDSYFRETLTLSKFILRSLYRIDSGNYEKFIDDPKNFLKSYSACLSKLGINLSVEWLNIKIHSEIQTYEKINNAFQNKRGMMDWINRKEIYDLTLNYGNIPMDTSEESINSWCIKFVRENYEFAMQLMYLRKTFEEKINQIVDEVKRNKANLKKYKSILNYTLNKIKVFRCGTIDDFIKETNNSLQHLNKAFLSNYKEGYEIAKNEVGKYDVDLNTYEYIVSIWLLGEYKNSDAVTLLEKRFIESLDKESFINTLITEALLKIGRISKKFQKNIVNKLSNVKSYYSVRNILFILNANTDIFSVIDSIDVSKYCMRTQIFIK